MSQNRTRLWPAIALACAFQLGLGAEESAANRTEQRRDAIKYGTEAEIGNLIKVLAAEKSEELDQELVALVQGSGNEKVMQSVFAFFAERKKVGLEERAKKILEEWDQEENGTILVAVDYLGKMGDASALAPITSLLDTKEKRFQNAALRALGRVGGGATAPETARYLMDFYQGIDDDDDNRREIISALGELRHNEALGFLAEKAADPEERPVRRMAAVEALAKIGDQAGLDSVIKAVDAVDPNLRAAAVGALYPFQGEQADQAILEAFRDSYYKTRLAAAKAAGERGLAAAVPFLRYRAERDDVPAVRDEALRALGKIGSSDALEVMAALFADKKTTERARVVAVEELLRIDADQYAPRIVAALDEAKAARQTTLYNSLAKALAAACTTKIQALASRFLASTDVIEKSYGLDMVKNNAFADLAEQVKALQDEKNEGISRKARAILESLGIK